MQALPAQRRRALLAVTAPAAPSALVKASATDTTMTVSWTDNSSNETGFELSWGTDGVTFATGSATPVANATSATATGLSANAVYYFRIRAVNGSGNSSYATSAALTTGPQAPTGLFVDTTTNSSITLRWTDNSSTETGFNVFRNGSFIYATTDNIDSHIDTGLDAVTSYDYFVTAFNVEGESNPTATVTGTTTS